TLHIHDSVIVHVAETARFAGDKALQIHGLFAVCVFAWLVWRIWRFHSHATRIALIFVGTCLITPYIHIYDLSILAAGGLLILRGSVSTREAAANPASCAAILAWFAPYATPSLAGAGLPIMPLIILFIFLTIRDWSQDASFGSLRRPS
ncbi:MAG TPA: hypothetical protein VFJ18_02100, partial [Pararhizobium sp.]|nr:hypothetical protein [Pararhizobium sp.]